MNRHSLFTVLFFLVQSLSVAAESAKPAAPFVNPYLAASNYSVTHARSNFTPLPGPIGPSRRLDADEIEWKTLGPANSWTPMYSNLYPNGKRVFWVGGYDRVSKLDADTLDVLTTYAIGGNTFFGDEEIRRHIATMDRLDREGMTEEYIDHVLKIWEEPIKTSVMTFYHLLDRDNVFYVPHRAKDGSISLQAYGEADAADPSSKILLRREWKIPSTISKAPVMSINMTADGWIVMATMDGALIILSRDFTEHHHVKLPSKRKEEANSKANAEFLSSFVRNGVETDDQGGIYVVTRDYMHRVQWTGKKLSMSRADGAWKAPYANEKGIGSGTTPGLMGWGPDEDHLVLIADGTWERNNMVAFWRDRIPDDWEGLPGHDRRVAGITKIHFGVSEDALVQVENQPAIYGYGVFFDNTFPVKRLPDQGSMTRTWLAEAFLAHIPGDHAMLGGTMIRWNPQQRELETAWSKPMNFVSSICTVSGATELLYCWGARDREWTLEGIDWHTGEDVFHYTLGKSHRFNPLGALILMTEDGSVDCGCSGGLGMVRIRPKGNPVTRK